VMEYWTSLSSLYLLFVELTTAQMAYVDNIFFEMGHMSPNNYNEMLNYCLLQSGRKKIMLYKLSINLNTTNCAMISVLGHHEDNPAGPTVTKLSSRLWKQVLPTNNNGVFDIEYGVVVQHIYEWPFQKQLQKHHFHLIKTCIANKGTPRCRTKIQGFYQNLGPRSTSQCSANIGAHPFTKQTHHQWNINMNGLLMPHMSKIRNQLRMESSSVSFSCGQLMTPLLKSVVGACEYNELFQCCLFTWQFCNTPHKDTWDVMSSEDTAQCMVILGKDLDDQVMNTKKETFLKNICSNMSNLEQRLPLETTCAWTMVEENDEYEFRQYFTNFLCGVALDISSTGFKRSDQIGSTFLGAMFEHCTTKPIWVRRDDGYISLNKPCREDNYAFAWGNHISRRKKNKTVGVTKKSV
jgi:hypothetical protein